MEAAKFVRRYGLATAAVILCGISFPTTVFEYEISAHSALTSAMFDEYAKRFPDAPIDERYRSALTQGSKDEDDGMRSLRHFYDPLNNRGLTWGGKAWPSAKRWVSDASLQGSKHFTWGDALELYAEGDEENAFRALGHVLHLLEDMSVPEHSRNDPHMMSSPYEQFTKSLIPVAPKKPPIILESLDAHFDALAKYSQDNFYSEDSIGDVYDTPKARYFSREGAYRYGFKQDDEGNKYYLINLEVVNQKEWFKSAPSLFDGDSNKVLSDYWRLLSDRAIRHGVGVMHLFIKEGEKLKREESTKRKVDEKKSFYAYAASVIDAFIPSASSADDGWEEIDDVASDSSGTAWSTAALRKKASAKAGEESARPSSASARSSPTTKAVVEKALPPTLCAYASTDTLSRASVIINEVAWMGSKASANAEWIELKNISAQAVDVSGFQIISLRGRIKVILDDGESIPAGGFYLLERTSNDAVPNISADDVYVGALSNSADGLRLFDTKCVLRDEAIGDPKWPAGNPAERRTMERAQDLSWHDYSGTASRMILGTPKKENSAPPPPKPALPVSGAVGGSQPPATAKPSSSGAGAPASTAPAPAQQRVSKGTVVVNEFLFDVAGSDVGREFIELFNTSASAIDLSGWSIQTQSAKKNFEADSAIPAHGCFLVALGSSAPQPAKGMRWASGSLNNTEGAIYLSQGEGFVSGPSDADVVDSTTYTKASYPTFTAGMSLERGESGGFHLRAVPNPADCSRGASAGASVSSSTSQSASASVKSSSPSGDFLKSVYFYTHPKSGNAVIDLRWDTYPFVPGRLGAWKALVFYLNSAPSSQKSLHTDSGWAPADASVLSITYPIYSVGYAPRARSLILPDSKDKSDTGGGLENAAYNWNLLTEDSMARVFPDAPVKKGDYITIGYYDFARSGGGDQELGLVYADPRKYFFDDPKPIFAGPIISGAPSESLDPRNGVGSITFPPAHDANSADNGIMFHWSFNGRVSFGRYTASISHSFFLSIGDDFEVEFSAENEFGIRSAPVEISTGPVGSVSWALVQVEGGGQSHVIGEENDNCTVACAPSASYQAVSFPTDTQANAVTVRLTSDRGIASLDIRMRVYADRDGAPDLATPIAEKIISPRSILMPAPADASFVFNAPIIFRKDIRYWLALDVVGYPNPHDRFSPYLRNIVSPTKGWYMKIGSWEP